MRTHHCNELRKEHIGQTATLIGWVNTKRDHHGVIFIDIRDREGITQAVFRSEEDAEAAKMSHGLRQEDIVRVTGTVSERPEIEGQATTNPNIDTGEIELVANSLEIVNHSEVLPFQLDKELSNEDLRLKHRYLDLRRPRMARNFRFGTGGGVDNHQQGLTPGPYHVKGCPKHRHYNMKWLFLSH